MLKLAKICCVLLAISSARHATAQTTAELLSAAHKKSKVAKTVEEYSAIIESCSVVLDDDVTDSQRQYAEKLVAWALNRRGEAYVRQAGTALAAGDEQAANDLDAAALADFEASLERDASRWKARHNRGVSYALIGKVDEAIEDFSEVIKQKPGYANAWFNRAELQYETGRHANAIADYTRALELKPGDFGAHTGRGHAHYELGQFDEALKDYDKAAKLDTQDADAFANRGDAHLKLSMWEKAAADYRRAITLDAQSAHAYRSVAWLLATCPDDRFRDSSLAVQTAERAIELGGRDPRFLDVLAAAYADAGRYDEASEALSEALELVPEQERPALHGRLDLYASQQPFRLASLPAASVRE